MKFLRSTVALAALLAAGPALANTTSDIDVAGGAIIPSLGLGVDLSGTSNWASHTRSSHAVELGFAAGRAKDDFRLRAGEDPVRFGGETFVGAQTLDYTANLQFAHLAYRYRYWFGTSNFAIEGLAGLGYAGLGLKVVGATQSAAERLSNGGLVLGVGGIWRFASNTALHLRMIGMGSGREEGINSAGRFEVTVAHNLGRHAIVRAGLGSIFAYSAREDDHDSDSVKSPIRASAGGIVLGFEAQF